MESLEAVLIILSFESFLAFLVNCLSFIFNFLSLFLLHSFPSNEFSAMQLKSFAESRPKEGIASTIGLHGWKDNKRIYNDDVGTKSNNENETKMEDVSDYNKSCSLRTPDSISKRSSYDKLNITWEDCGKMGTRSSSLDTSGIQSNDWSSDTHSDMQNTFLCLSDELATTDYKLDNSQVLLFKTRIVLIKFAHRC